MTVAHPIARAWLSAGGPAGQTTGAQNYDEFADDAEITRSGPAGDVVSELGLPHHVLDPALRPAGAPEGGGCDHLGERRPTVP